MENLLVNKRSAGFEETMDPPIPNTRAPQTQCRGTGVFAGRFYRYCFLGGGGGGV